MYVPCVQAVMGVVFLLFFQTRKVVFSHFKIQGLSVTGIRFVGLTMIERKLDPKIKGTVKALLGAKAGTEWRHSINRVIILAL